MVTKYQFGSAEHLTIAAAAEQAPVSLAPAPREEPSTRVYSGVTRYTAGQQEEASTTEVTQYTSSTAGAPQGSVLGTLNSTFGQPSVELVPGVPGSRTLVDVAIKEGLLRRVNGQLEDASTAFSTSVAGAAPPAPQGTSASVEQELPQELGTPDPEDAEVIDAQDDATWNEDIAPLPQSAYDGAVASVIGLLVGGRGSVEQTARDLASRAGIEVADAMEYLDAGHSYYATQVNKALAPLGIVGPQLNEFRAFASKQSGRFQDAIQNAVHLREFSGFRKLGAEFIRSKNG